MSTQEASKQTRTGPCAQENQQGVEQQSRNGTSHNTVTPSPSQVETLMNTQEANERAELKLAEKEKATDDQVHPTGRTQTQPSVGPPVKATYHQAHAQPANLIQTNGSVSGQNSSASSPAASTVTSNVAVPQPADAHALTTPNAPNTSSSTNALPVKRGPGRPRKSGVQIGPPPAKRLRGRPRNVTTPVGLGRQRNEATSEAESEVPNVDNSDDSDYHDTNDASSPTVPPNILAQFNAHVSILRTRLDSRGIPEQYSMFKSFWLPTRASYFDGGATAPPGRFVYWDPLFITSVACPVCQQPLAIAAGGGWLDAPLNIRDEDGSCWIIGRRYVCTQCFAATEEAARYVQGGADLATGASNPASSGAPGDGKPKIDFSSPVYYISWEKRFRALLPPALAAEFPKRSRKRAAFNRAARGIVASGDVDVDMEGEGEEEETPKRSRRVRHCMKCSSKSCAGRLTRSRCPNPCHDCGLSTCSGRLKPNITCKGELGSVFKEVSPDESSSVASPTGTRTPAPPQPLSWPAGLPNVPSGFVLAIPYPVGTDGKPTGAQPAMAYLVPQGDVPGFSTTPINNQAGASSSTIAAGTETSSSAAGSTPGPSAPTMTSGTTEITHTAFTAGSFRQAPQQERLHAVDKDSLCRASAQSKAAPKQKTQTPQQKAPTHTQSQAQTTLTSSQAPTSMLTPSHMTPHLSHHPQPPPNPIAHPPHPLPNHSSPYPPSAPYPPPPALPGGSPDPGFYGAFYSYGYVPPYGYGYYPPYPAQGPTLNPAPGVVTAENGAVPPGYPQYVPYPPPGYGIPPPPGNTYPSVNNAYVAPPPGSSAPAPTNGYNVATQNAQGQQSQPQPQPMQYMPYQPPDPNQPTTAIGSTSGPATRKRKAQGAGEKTTEVRGTA